MGSVLNYPAGKAGHCDKHNEKFIVQFPFPASVLLHVMCLGVQVNSFGSDHSIGVIHRRYAELHVEHCSLKAAAAAAGCTDASSGVQGFNCSL